MNIALIGASGYVGSALLAEALQRGHTVTALVQHPEKLQATPTLRALKADVLDSTTLPTVLRGHDAVISAFSGHAQADIEAYYLQGFRSILQAVKQAAVPRLLVVGGAASLQVAPGVELLDNPAFPEQWKPTARGARAALLLLRDEPQLDWTVLSPSAHLEPGERTGRFRLGAEELLVDSQGDSRISLQDYALAMLDELERPAHSRRRFTVGY